MKSQTPMFKRQKTPNLMMTTRVLKISADWSFFGVWRFVICDFLPNENLTSSPRI
jgi:hypothetical protein